jgi:hypothetical protein
MLNIISALLLSAFIESKAMIPKTLLEFATEKMLTILLVKERAKCRRRNRNDKHHTLDKECDIQELSSRKMLSRMMPPRYTWVRPSKKIKLANHASDTSKNAEKALLLSISRDRKRQSEGVSFPYLDEMDLFFNKIRSRLASEDLHFESPRLMPILKKVEKKDDQTIHVTCRPLSVYTQLEDKIILALTSRYLTSYFDRFLHENILSYRPARSFQGKVHYVTDFNDGVELIKAFRNTHNNSTIFAADCDIKKFYDIIPHQVVRDCFWRLLHMSELDDDGKRQVMKVVEAYLDSYNFYTNAWLESTRNVSVFDKVRRRLHDYQNNNTYELQWVNDIWKLPREEYLHLGVPQGGALSLLVANIVLNDVDKVLVSTHDDNMLFIRYCDDMILLHTDYDECCRLIGLYAQSLKQHGLYYHDFGNVADGSRSRFWELKSHRPFLWGDGAGNCNRYIGFLGYEIRRDGRLRLRKSNIKRFEEKFNRLRYALHRYRQSHSEEEFQAHQKKVLDNVLDGVAFYSSLDLQQFKQGSQYRHLWKLRQRFFE